jgi:hypothetical protein
MRPLGTVGRGAVTDYIRVSGQGICVAAGERVHYGS